MLQRLADLRKYTIGATDGDIGQVRDFLFEDQRWTVRYLVVDTGTWLSGRKVLISPFSIEHVEPEGRRVMTRLTTDQVKNSPDIDTDRPVSRQHEAQLHSYYRYPDYVAGPYRWGLWAFPYGPVLPPDPEIAAIETRSRSVADEIAAANERAGDPHLHSAREVSGYGVHATDGDLGHVEDFLVDADSWAIRYLVVDPRNWWPGPHVVLSTEWIDGVSWADRHVRVNVDRQAVRDAPPFDPARLLEHEWEHHLHRYYGRPGYWERPAESVRRRPPAA